MWRLAPYAVGALISASFVAGYWTGSEPFSAHAAPFASRWLSLSPAQSRQDRLPLHRIALRRSDRVQTIEIIGDDHATVIYRDRNGSIVFRNDPHARTTVAAKGVVLPAVPVGNETEVAPAPQAPRQPLPAQKLMEGCEPALSPLASREASSFGGRCLASRDGAATAGAA